MSFLFSKPLKLLLLILPGYTGTGFAQLPKACKPAPPIAILGPDTICWGVPSHFSTDTTMPGAVYGWAISDGWLSKTNGQSVAAAFKGPPPYTIYLWRESVEPPYCHSDTITKTVYPPSVHLNLSGPDTVTASSYATYHTGYEGAEVYEWKIYNPLTGSVAQGGQGSSATILWNEVAAPGVTAYIVALARKCGWYYSDTMAVYVKAGAPLPKQKIRKGKLYEARCLGDSYEVTLAVPAPYHKPAAGDTFNWYINDVLVAATGAPAYSLGLPADSTYRIRLVQQQRNRRAPSTTHDILRLPPLPHAAFTASTTTPCVEDQAVYFTNLSDTATLSSHWNFGDASLNTRHNPCKVFSSYLSGIFAVVLTVTDAYGCIDTAVGIINAKSKDLDGGVIMADPAFPCRQSPVMLYYVLGAGTAFPDTLRWMQLGGPLLATTAAPEYRADMVPSGGYWVQAVNRPGCVDNSPIYPVLRTEVPQPVIRGATSQLAGIAFRLNGYAGSSDAYTYTWRRDGAVVGTDAILPQSGLAAGTYSYTLTLSVKKPDGQTCSETSAPFTLTVHAATQQQPVN